MIKKGRHTKYSSKYCRQLILFFEEDPYYEVEVPHYYPKGEVKWVDFKRLPHKLPTVREFCKQINIHYDTFYAWVKKHKAFSDAFTHAKDLQKWFLIENGLNGLYNPAFAIFVATNITDMVNKSENENKVTFDDQQIDRIAERIASRSRGDGNTPSKEKSN